MLENTTKPGADGYDFDELRFSPNESKVTCVKTGEEIFLRRNLSEFLFLLLQKPRKTVEYAEFRDKVAAWTIYKDVAQLTRTIHVTKGELNKNLRLLRENFDLIEAVPAKGYRLSADVTAFFMTDTTASNVNSENLEEFTSKAAAEKATFSRRLFGGHPRQAFFSCAIYASLFVVALFIEIAYEFETLKNLAFSLAVPSFIWIWLTSAAGLFFSRKAAGKSASASFILPILTFLLSSISLQLFLGVFLPETAITQANFQTYPASAAYLKNIFYFLPLGIFLICLPFSAIIWFEKEINENDGAGVSDLRKLRRRRISIANFLFFSAKLLFGLIIAGIFFSLLATAHLFDNLKPNQHLNFFMQLVLWRCFLYFGLAAECLIWYWLAVKSLKEAAL